MTATGMTAIAKPPAARGMSSEVMASVSVVIVAALALTCHAMGLVDGVSDASPWSSESCEYSIREDLVTVGGFALGAAVVHLARSGHVAWSGATSMEPPAVQSRLGPTLLQRMRVGAVVSAVVDDAVAELSPLVPPEAWLAGALPRRRRMFEVR
eukprot:CAMPEP_0176098714 /NCGR_PEP_ID=MMETSP0120_2-20121206/49497_1 /TAXON_ID=160619 /ORGANISM="Kryptoperidinium foliaceum, Strain CCMP 1326" /LENGTH=153 /DNA_ID=CAMNT_0017432727 /DNA_START=156 /DNA_END=615 /DNA_ORIENTATION=-